MKRFTLLLAAIAVMIMFVGCPNTVTPTTTVPQGTETSEQHTIVYANLNENGTTVMTSYAENETVVLQEITRTGYTFRGWFDGTTDAAQQVTGWDAGTHTDNVVLWAKWEPISVTVTLSNGSASKTVTAVYGDYLPNVDVPTQAGLVFSGYYTEKNRGGVRYIDEEGQGYRIFKATAAMTLYAGWKNASSSGAGTDASGDSTETVNPYYTILFNSNGGTGVMSKMVCEIGTEYTLPQCGFTAPSGKIFGGWDIGAAGSKFTDLSETNGDIIIASPQWRDPLFIAGEGVYTGEAAKSDIGDTFIWWRGFALVLIKGDIPAGEPIDPNTYGTAAEPVYQIKEGKGGSNIHFITNPAAQGNVYCSPSQGTEGFVFAGVAASLTTNNFKLFVDMSKITKEEVVVLLDGESIGASEWNEDIDLTDYKPYVIALFDDEANVGTFSYETNAWTAPMFSMETDLDAVYPSKFVSFTEYTIEYDNSPIAWDVNPEKVLEGTTAVAPSALHEGRVYRLEFEVTHLIYYYMFGGWYTDDGFVNKYDFDTPVNNDFTLYAKWENWGEADESLFMVQFDYGPINMTSAPLFVAEGNTVSYPSGFGIGQIFTDSQNKQYAFDGWYLDKAYTEEYDFATPVTSDIMLYAKFKDPYVNSIVYHDLEDGISNSPLTFDIRENVTLGKASREGYYFAGWYDGTDDNAEQVMGWKAGNKLEDVELYARWAQGIYVAGFNGVWPETDSAEGLPQLTTQDGYLYTVTLTAESDNPMPDGIKLVSSLGFAFQFIHEGYFIYGRTVSTRYVDNDSGTVLVGVDRGEMEARDASGDLLYFDCNSKIYLMKKVTEGASVTFNLYMGSDRIWLYVDYQSTGAPAYPELGSADFVPAIHTSAGIYPLTYNPGLADNANEFVYECTFMFIAENNSAWGDEGSADDSLWFGVTVSEDSWGHKFSGLPAVVNQWSPLVYDREGNCVVTGLTNGKTYDIKVKASNCYYPPKIWDDSSVSIIFEEQP